MIERNAMVLIVHRANDFTTRNPCLDANKPATPAGQMLKSVVRPSRRSISS